MDHLIQANLHFLGQADRLLARLSAETYARPIETFYHSTVGQHLRHCLDHYWSFLGGCQTSKVDYDCRERRGAVESCLRTAGATVDDLRERLENLRQNEPPVGLLVKMDCGTGGDDWQPSTAGRELQFLVSHTVHHFAMIGGMCQVLGVELEPGFGVAPSTLEHQKSGQA